MTWLLIALAVVPPGICCAWIAWDERVRYGPILYGNTRWRREAPLRQAASEQREWLAALTPEDRAWLAARGWRA